MANILIFRTAKFEIIDQLMLDIKKKYRNECTINFIVQEEMCDELEKRYKEINIFKCNNGFLTINSYNNSPVKQEVSKKKYDYIYIPVSTNNINNYTEIIKIAQQISKNNVLVFKPDFKYEKVKKNQIMKINLSKKIMYGKNMISFFSYKTIYIMSIVYFNLTRSKK